VPVRAVCPFPRQYCILGRSVFSTARYSAFEIRYRRGRYRLDRKRAGQRGDVGDGACGVIGSRAQGPHVRWRGKRLGRNVLSNNALTRSGTWSAGRNARGEQFEEIGCGDEIRRASAAIRPTV